MTKLIRISDAIARTLDDISHLTGEHPEKILEEAIAHYKNELFLAMANEQYSTLKKRPNTWKKIQKESSTWDMTMLDGLNDED